MYYLALNFNQTGAVVFLMSRDSGRKRVLCSHDDDSTRTGGDDDRRGRRRRIYNITARSYTALTRVTCSLVGCHVIGHTIARRRLPLMSYGSRRLWSSLTHVAAADSASFALQSFHRRISFVRTGAGLSYHAESNYAPAGTERRNTRRA